ncbi:YbaK/EbsC family protein [Paenibacillus alvei]|uniref:YbaK/EbsC family protein n=1 Tax=Paenibacillus TaxID=44249 RepID=UPI0002882819|nr:YbaK/EbsC family protein [Paenibacillus alvei]EJW19062.1 YbaK/prolyl-tRNA synthetase [Paenibacillus alvei DSM 29]MCY7486367.1 YbaK/EbsC family protein [Paenibacillus alvei]MCY9542234.1 YbaK/EbsC family protein [Paenibacillus alvei]MCY9707329.1 YbaK/EbsC family protein [Paenibacillus alvei]MCY9736242.1 YbaK/EbsC family protein [Paenibacillus alvei]
MSKLKGSAQSVQDKLSAMGLPNLVIELPDSTRTAEEAANTIGCELSQIAKSIIFRRKEANLPLLVVASGVNRVNEKRIGHLLNEKLGKADADFVREHTGFVIGGVPPITHKDPIVTIIDEDLMQVEVIWAAAGHPQAVFQLTPMELVEMTNGTVARIT